VSHPDAFALKNSGLNEFLFAEVGTELNGSPLTVLSVLARLGLDPWAEAARWAKLPPKALRDTLARSIAQMPLSEQAINEAPQTASRLIRLLPEQSKTGQQGGTIASTTAEGLGWVPLTFVIVAIAMGIAINLTTRPTIANQPPTTQTTAPNPDAVTVPRTG
jgi:hypothetical protein